MTLIEVVDPGKSFSAMTESLPLASVAPEEKRRWYNFLIVLYDTRGRKVNEGIH
jgi:hypothetical protein